MNTSNKIAIAGLIATILIAASSMLFEEDKDEPVPFQIHQTIEGNTNAVINKTINVNTWNEN